MSEAQYLQRLPEKALDALYESLSVQTMPEGSYDGRAWIHGHPVLGGLASRVWKGKVFDGRLVRNRILGMLIVRGRAADLDSTVLILYRYVLLRIEVLRIEDRVRQVSPTLYLGRMQWRRWTVHFTLSKER